LQVRMCLKKTLFHKQIALLLLENQQKKKYYKLSTVSGMRYVIHTEKNH